MEFTYNFRCCVCGAEMKECTPSNQCPRCLQKDIDLSDGVGVDYMHFCKRCGRYEDCKKKWKLCEWDSRNLMALTLKLVKGVGRKEQPHIVDASFIYTEPNSRRIKLKLQLEKEIVAGTIMQQSHKIEIVVRTLQCVDCERDFTPHTWNTVVQVRQRCEQKRTFHQLEQLLLENTTLEKLLKIEHHEDGIDFFFNGPKQATPKLVEYLKSWVVGKEKHSKHLVSHNVQNSTAKFKRAFYLELCPLSRGDLVFLPKKIAKALAAPQLLLVLRVRSNIHLVSPGSGRYYDISRDQYWKNPFNACATFQQLREFVVMDDSNLPEVTVAQTRDLGTVDDCLVQTRTHFQVAASDEVLAYDLVNTVIPALDAVDEDDRPDVILVERKNAKTVFIDRNGVPLRPLKEAQQGKEDGTSNVLDNNILDDAEIPEDEIKDLVNIITAPPDDEEEEDDPISEKHAENSE
eukprot:GEMP01034858.1.p1 GENE.GEMP01034858.1~~GEMP01034858.1.p1  ORF type:complete len:459 (+),score=95.72 GEMP01034858.1:90-1466(+)